MCVSAIWRATQNEDAVLKVYKNHYTRKTVLRPIFTMENPIYWILAKEIQFHHLLSIELLTKLWIALSADLVIT